LRTHTTENLRFIIAGNLKEDRKQAILRMLESWELSHGERFGLVREELVGALEPIHILRKDVENVVFGLSVQANWRMPDNENDAMAVLNHMLTGTLHSAILGRAREKGLAYGMWSDFIVSDSASEWDFGGQVSLQNASKLFAIMCEEVQKVLDGQVAASDIDASKQFALGKHQMGCQTVAAIASWYGRRYYFDGYIDDYADRPKAIAAVNKETIIKAASDLMGGKRWAFGGLGQCNDTQLKELHGQLSRLFE
jgi:predicted Zn-dependent peptidase